MTRKESAAGKKGESRARGDAEGAARRGPGRPAGSVGGPQAPQQPFVVVGLRAELVAQADQLIEDYPEYGWRHRSDFASEALRWMMLKVREDVRFRQAERARLGNDPGPYTFLEREQSGD